MPFDECFSKALKINKVRYPSVGWICHHLADSTRFRGDWQTVKYNLQMTVLVNQSDEHGSDLCSSEHYLSSSNNKAWKKFRPAWDLNPWPLKKLVQLKWYMKSSDSNNSPWVSREPVSITISKRPNWWCPKKIICTVKKLCTVQLN